VLARKTPRDFSTDALTVPSGFTGVDGLFRLLADGTAERGYGIDEVVPNGTPREIDPAPASFGPSGS
jgi:branched-chain amino acid transport system substrate-binding protein